MLIIPNLRFVPTFKSKQIPPQKFLKIFNFGWGENCLKYIYFDCKNFEFGVPFEFLFPYLNCKKFIIYFIFYFIIFLFIFHLIVFSHLLLHRLICTAGSRSGSPNRLTFVPSLQPDVAVSSMKSSTTPVRTRKTKPLVVKSQCSSRETSPDRRGLSKFLNFLLIYFLFQRR